MNNIAQREKYISNSSSSSKSAIFVIVTVIVVRSVFRISNLFLRPRPWQFEIRDSTDKQATCLCIGFETLNLKICDLKLWKLTVGPLNLWFYRESPGKFDSRTLSRETLNRWIGRSSSARAPGVQVAQHEAGALMRVCIYCDSIICIYIYIYIYMYICISIV